MEMLVKCLTIIEYTVSFSVSSFLLCNNDTVALWNIYRADYNSTI